MQFAQLIVENTFVKSTTINYEVGATVYERVFQKLLTQGGSLGKVHPIYLKIGERLLIFGILTINSGGSYSFFPELPGDYHFDHITFSQNLQKNSHHYTKTTWLGREKILPLYAQKLTNDTYHAITFLYRDHGLLIEAPKEIYYPKTPIEKLPELNNAFNLTGKIEGSTIIEFPHTLDPVCLQFLLLPKGIHHKKMTAFDVQLEDGITCLKNYVIPPSHKSEYAVGIVAFIYPHKIQTSLSILAAVAQKAFYSKLDIIWQKK